MDTKKNAPIKVSGQVYAFKLLAKDRPDFASPEGLVLQRGDIKLITVPKRRGGGFFTAYIYDGENGHQWRKLALRDGAAIEATYGSNAERIARLPDIVRRLRRLKDWEATWAHKTYVVLPNQVVAPQKPLTQQVLF
jgi:hypothetical protein